MSHEKKFALMFYTKVSPIQKHTGVHFVEGVYENIYGRSSILWGEAVSRAVRLITVSTNDDSDTEVKAADPWFWIMYFKEGTEKVSATRTDSYIFC